MPEICNQCNEIISGKILTALDKKWHPEHFKCAHCNQPIGNEKFHQQEGKVYCGSDFTNLFLPKCNTCKQPIHNKVIKALGLSWHEEHWACASCGVKLSNSGFKERDNKPFCAGCYGDKYAPKCAGCTKPILDKTVLALDKSWHQDCFKCGKCKKPVTESSFAVENDKPLCGKCSK